MFYLLSHAIQMIQHPTLLCTDLSCEKYTVSMKYLFRIYEGSARAVCDRREWTDLLKRRRPSCTTHCPLWSQISTIQDFEQCLPLLMSCNFCLRMKDFRDNESSSYWTGERDLSRQNGYLHDPEMYIGRYTVLSESTYKRTSRGR